MRSGSNHVAVSLSYALIGLGIVALVILAHLGGPVYLSYVAAVWSVVWLSVAESLVGSRIEGEVEALRHAYAVATARQVPGLTQLACNSCGAPSGPSSTPHASDCLEAPHRGRRVTNDQVEAPPATGRRFAPELTTFDKTR